MDRDKEVESVFTAYRSGRVYVNDNGQIRPKPCKEQEELWQRLWEVVDFSWQGLADAGWERREHANEAQKLKRWQAPPDFRNGGIEVGKDEGAYIQATLQDYWRWLPNEDWTADQGFAGGRLLSDKELNQHQLLVEPYGKVYHAIHVRNVVTPYLQKAIVARLQLARFGSNANLTGAMAGNLGSCFKAFTEIAQTKKSIFVSASIARLDGIEASNMSFGSDTSFEQSKFGDRASFSNTEFGDNTRFTESIFGDFSNFSEARFGTGAGFNSAAFGKSTEFASANFGGSSDFAKATFGDDASFDQADFVSGAFFYEASLGNRTRFNNAMFRKWVSFNSSQFGDEADFDSACFEGNTSLESASFGGKAFFDKATFKELDLSRSKFVGTVSARHISCAGRFQMRAGEVGGYADFSDAVWPEKLEDQHAAFEGCRFRDVANFKTKDFSAFSLFDGAVFGNNLLLTEPVTGQTTSDQLFDRALQAAREAAERDESAACDLAKRYRDWKVNEKRKPDDEPKDPTPEERGEDARYGALAGGLRTVRRAMAAQGDIDREHRFYRYELKARAQRPSEPIAAKIAACIYGRVSDYGASIGRPIVILGLSLVTFAAIYFCLGWKLGIHVEGSSVSQALSLSLNNTFRPLSTLSVKDFQDGTLGHGLLTHGDWTRNLVHGIQILQSLIAVAILFLFGLALRRRFRIS
jgi:hypothetical protein